MYHKGSFCGGSNIDLELITCDDKIAISSKLQGYLLHWYHTYLLHPGMDRTETMICQHLYWPRIIHTVRKEITNCDSFQCTKRSLHIVFQPLVLQAHQPLTWLLHARVTTTSGNKPHTPSTDVDEIMMKRGVGRVGRAEIAWTAPAWPSSGRRGPGRATAREWRRLGLSPFRKKPPDTYIKPGWCQDLEEK